MGITVEQLRSDRRRDASLLIDGIARADGAPPLSESKWMRLEGRLDTREVIAVADHDTLVGYGQAAWHAGAGGKLGHWALEIAVIAGHRKTDVPEALVAALQDEIGDAEILLWSRTDYVSHTARAAGWQRERLLWEMRRSLPIPDLDTDLPGIRLASFRMGIDEQAWLDANNAAFAGHPENGDMTRRDLERRMAQSWFDPDGFFLAWSDDRLLGSCWTKLHEDGVGEIYIIGVIPEAEGRGLGRGLIAVGLDHLARIRHARVGMLFVESSNERAVRIYRSLGFDAVRSVEAYRPGRMQVV